MKLMRKTFDGNIRKLGFDQINFLPNQWLLTSKSAILKLGYTSSLQGVGRILNHIKKAHIREAKGFKGMQRGLSLDFGVQKVFFVLILCLGKLVTKGWEPPVFMLIYQS